MSPFLKVWSTAAAARGAPASSRRRDGLRASDPLIDMKDGLVFFQIKDASLHPLTRIGYKTLSSNGQTIVYCTEDGPLDPHYRGEWLEWKKKTAESNTNDER